MTASREWESSSVVSEFEADYWDAYRIAHDVEARPSAWAAAALGGVEAAHRAFGTLVWHGLLGFNLAPRGAAGTLVGWRITADTDDVFVMDVHGPRSSGRMVFAHDGDHLLWTTMLRHHGRAGAAVWKVLGNGHRALAPRCLEHAHRSLTKHH